ncbi:MAG: RING finger protein [Clostridia bacterium]|nr:RING finger protein [Clostridia bacterium]
MKYTGKSCSICNIQFVESDDVVVCPDCGTPYHRACYDSAGECVFKNLHIEGYSYENSKNNANNGNSESAHAIICPFCNHNNSKNALFCERCGRSLNNANQRTEFNDASQMFKMFDPMAGVNPDEVFKEDVTAGETAKYVKVNTQYYINVFNKISKKRGIGRFNFSAMIFSGGWMLYRKQYIKGAIITAIIALLMIGSLFINNAYTVDIATKLLENAGISSSSSVADIQQHMPQIMTEMERLSLTDKILYFLPSVLDMIRYSISIILGIFGNRLYYKHCMNQIKKIKSEDNGLGVSSSDKLQTSGGVNTKIAICLLICTIIINYIPYFIN